MDFSIFNQKKIYSLKQNKINALRQSGMNPIVKLIPFRKIIPKKIDQNNRGEYVQNRILGYCNSAHKHDRSKIFAESNSATPKYPRYGLWSNLALGSDNGKEPLFIGQNIII
jgi:hypothetical protein